MRTKQPLRVPTRKAMEQAGPLSIPSELRDLIGRDKELALPATSPNSNFELMDALRKGYEFVSSDLLEKLVQRPGDITGFETLKEDKRIVFSGGNGFKHYLMCISKEKKRELDKEQDAISHDQLRDIKHKFTDDPYISGGIKMGDEVENDDL